MRVENSDSEASGDVVGTVRLFNTADSSCNGHGGDIVLVPTPSSDSADPLNWSSSRKSRSLLCICIYTIGIGVASAAPYPIFGQMLQSTDLSLSDLNTGTGYMFLMFGWSCLFWHPVALRCGKRPVFLVSILATTATQIWAPHATSKLQWTFNRIIQGFFGGPVEFLCQVSLADIFFHHERGDKIAWYAASLGGSSFAAPIAAGFIERGQEWEWVLYWAGILCAIGFLLLLFFMEETNFKRHAGNDPIATATLRQNVLSATTQVTETQFDADEKTSSWWTISNLMQITRKKHLNRVLSDMSRPVQMLRFPLLCFAGFLYGSNLIWFNALNATTSLVFGGHAYEFLPWSIGLTYLSPMAGAILASIYTGLLGDKLGLWIARRNNGNLEAEYRLWLLAPCLMILPSGLILWGVAATNQLHWSVCVIAMGLVAFAIGCGMQVAICYSIDCYKALCAEALVAVMLIRNTMSFVIGYGITPWVDSLGLQHGFILAGFLALLQTAIALSFISIGKRLRIRWGPRFADYVESSS